MKIFDLAFKDISQILRDRKSLLFLVAMPIIFTLFMGLAFRGETTPQDSRIPLAWVDSEPDALLNKTLFTRLETSDTIKLMLMENDAALDALNKNKVDGVLIVPDGFTQQAMNGDAVQLALITDPVSTKGQTLYQTLRVDVAQLMSAVKIAQIDVNTIDTQKNLSVEAKTTEQNAAFENAWNAWTENQKQNLIQIEKAVGQATSAPYGGNPYNQTSPGILVQFAVFGLVTSAQILVQERKTRTLQRLMTTSMKPWEIIAGHMLAMFAIVFLQTIMLVVFGQLALKVDYLRQPLAILLVSIALGLWVSSMGLLIGVWAKAEDQVVLYSLIAMFLFSALGGAWFPLEGSGKTFALIGHLTPAAWAMDGYQNILMRGLSLNSIWFPVVVLTGYGLFFFLLAVWRFRKSQ